MAKMITLAELRDLVKSDRQNLYIAAQGSKYGRPMVYNHWTAGGHDAVNFPDYLVVIDGAGRFWWTGGRLADVRRHTAGRNSGAVGVAIACCLGAVCGDDPQGPDSIDFGEAPPTAEQIESLAQFNAVVLDGLGLPATYTYLRTHAEQAIEDDYGVGSGDPEMRWDLLYLPGCLEKGGDLIRGKTAFYLDRLARGEWPL